MKHTHKHIYKYIYLIVLYNIIMCQIIFILMNLMKLNDN
jgi:hypothetical protein